MYIAMLLLCQIPLPPALPALPEPVAFETLRVADEAATSTPLVAMTPGGELPTFVSLPRPLARLQSCAGGSCQLPAAEPRRYEPLKRLRGVLRWRK